jgi:protein-tyrosine phosphatase
MPFLWIGLLTFGGVAALFGILTARRKRIRYPEPSTYIVEPSAEVTVKRIENGEIELRWNDPAATTKIFVGAQPDVYGDEPVVEVTGESFARLSNLDPSIRHYFKLVFDNSRHLLASERFLPLQGSVNFRDFGGYETADGRRVKWGKLFRSGTLSDLTSDDYAYIERVGIKLVCDLRSPEEIAIEPDNLPQSMHYVHTSIYTDSDSARRLRALFFDPRALALLMLEMYTRQMIDRNARPIGDVLRRLAHPDNLPALIHCTAGKDRTGITAAVLLSTLGVPDATITADYSLSNHYFSSFQRIVQKALPQRLAYFGITIDDMRPLLTANPEMLQSVLDHIRQRYGSVEGYLRDAAGLDDATIARLKSQLLE